MLMPLLLEAAAFAQEPAPGFTLEEIWQHSGLIARTVIVILMIMLLGTLVIGIDALPTPDGGIKSVMDGRIDVTYVYPTGGKEAIDWAVKILKDKETPPKEVVLETEEVTSKNAAEIYTKYGGK